MPAVVVVAGCFGGGPRAHEPAEVGPPATAATVTRVRVGYGAYEVRYGLGRVWAATAAGVAGVDAASGHIVGKAVIHSDSEWSNVAVGGGSGGS